MNYGSVCTGIESLSRRKQELAALSSQAKGAIAEYAVAARLVEMGFTVWTPFIQNTKADIAVSVGFRLISIQVKSATYVSQDDRFKAPLHTRDSKTRKPLSYKEIDFDFFIVHCPGLEDKYVIPVAVGVKYSSANLLPHREGIRFQRDPQWNQYKNAFHLLREVQ